MKALTVARSHPRTARGCTRVCSRCAPSTRLGAEAVATRAVFDATRDGSLHYFAPVAATPGFPRALARTLQELRLAGLPAGSLAPLPLAGPDLAVLLGRFEACFTDAALVDRADLFRTAATVLRESRTPTYDFVVFLDVPLDHAAEREFVAAVIAVRAPRDRGGVAQRAFR